MAVAGLNQRILLNPCGSAGDVHPYLAIGMQLQAMGHEVFVLTNACYEPKVRKAGLTIVPIGEPLDWQVISRDPKVHHPRTAWREAMLWAVIGTMRETYQRIEELYIPGSTALAAPVWSVGARIAREKLGIPLATVVLNPMLLRSTLHAPVTPQMYMPDWMPRWMKRWQYFVGDLLFIDPLIGPPIREFRKELALPKTTRRWMHRWWFSPDRVYGMFASNLVPKQDDWLFPVELVGPTLWDPPGDPVVDEMAMAFVQSGPAPICFVPGSVGADGHVFDLVAQACREMGERILMLHGSFATPCLTPDQRELRAAYTPLANVLPHCKAIIHCGCAGTASHGLRVGIPHVVWPRVNDQFDIAARIRRLGVGEVIARNHLSSRAIQASLRQVGGSLAMQAACLQVKTEMAKWDGSRSVAEGLRHLTCCDTTVPTPPSR